MAERVFEARRRIRLGDTDATGRLRLDAVARYLQDVASDDVIDAGWATGEHVWVVRRTWIEIVEPYCDDETVALRTWCSGVAGSAAARRYTVVGDRGGVIEAESIWIHLDHDLQPLRLGDRFLEVYGPSARGARASTRLELPGAPSTGGARWPLRATDADRLGHVNNAVYWLPVEERWGERLTAPARVLLEYRKPVDTSEDVVLEQAADALWLRVGAETRAAAAILARS